MKPVAMSKSLRKIGVTPRAEKLAGIWGNLKRCLEDNLKIDVKFMDDDEAMEHDCDLTSCEGDMCH